MQSRLPEDRAQSRWLRQLPRSGGGAGRLALGLPFVSAALLLVQAYFLADILHALIVAHRPLAAIWGPVAALAALIVLRALIGGMAEIAAIRAGEAIKLGLRKVLTAGLFAKGPVWTAGKPSGSLSSLLVDQVEAMDGYFVRYIPAMLQAAIVPLAFAAIILPVDWVVALLFLVTAPLIPVFMALAGWGAEAASKAQAGALSRLSAHFADRLRGLITLKLFSREAAEIEGVTAASEELRLRTTRVMRIAFLSSAVLEFFAALGVAGVALYVGLTFLDLISLRADELTLRAGLFCLLMAPEVYQPLRLLAAHYHDRAAAKAAAAEIEKHLEKLPDAEAPRTTPAGAMAMTSGGAAALHLAQVEVATPDGRLVIAGATIDVSAGQHVAVLGASGAGKSTLIEAIAGLREHSGGIYLDGAELGTIDEAALRTRIAVLGQRPRLFAGSIGDNIRLGRREACDTAVRIAAERACVTAFTDALPFGLATQLGENGLGLSGGEVQRIALARLYLRDPGLVLLDEPTAHLDTHTEALVLDGLMAFATTRTLVVATHSPAVAARMQRVYRIAQGHLLPATRPLRVATSRGRYAA